MAYTIKNGKFLSLEYDAWVSLLEHHIIDYFVKKYATLFYCAEWVLEWQALWKNVLVAGIEHMTSWSRANSAYHRPLPWPGICKHAIKYSLCQKNKRINSCVGKMATIPWYRWIFFITHFGELVQDWKRWKEKLNILAQNESAYSSRINFRPMHWSLIRLTRYLLCKYATTVRYR